MSLKIKSSRPSYQRNNGECYFKFSIGKGAGMRFCEYDLDKKVVQSTEPVKIDEVILPSGASFWFYREKVFEVTGVEFCSDEEIILKIKHTFLKNDKDTKKLKKEIDVFENLKEVNQLRRERIPDTVRLFVWQRDGGKCVNCGSKEKLEFDHVIPLVEGGSSTERNIQLLCETCNRSKGKNISH